MRYSQISKHLRQRGELLLSGQIDRLSADFIYPLPLFMQSSQLVITSPNHAWMIFDHLRTALVERGVVALRPKISAIDLPRAGRFRVWVDWHELAIPAEQSRQSSVIYYCRTSGPGLRVEMVQYTRLSMPELSPHFASLALSA